MSGGEWGYACFRVMEFAERLAMENESQETKNQRLRYKFAKHLESCATAMRSIEWVDSGDYSEGAEEDDILIALNYRLHGVEI